MNRIPTDIHKREVYNKGLIGYIGLTSTQKVTDSQNNSNVARQAIALEARQEARRRSSNG